MSHNRSFIFLAIIFVLGLFLRLYLLSSSMVFIGDQAWFFISARNSLLTGQFPLLGITSSVTWLHQGPLYTYLLIPELAIFHFYPVSAGVFTGFLSALTIVLCYFLTRIWFDSRAGLAAAFIFATSPLAITHARMPYHTSPIPLFLGLALLLLQRKKYFLSFLFWGFLYQLELVTVIFWPVLVFFLIRNKYSPKLLDIFALLLGIIPFLISGPISTLGVFIWGIYHLFTGSGSIPLPLNFYSSLLHLFFLPGIPLVAPFLLILSILFAFWAKSLKIIWLIVPTVFIFVNKTTSEAYFTLLFLPLAIFSGYFISRLFTKSSLFIFFIAWWLINAHYLLVRNYQINPLAYGAPFSSRLNISDHILAQSATSTPHLIAVGPGSEFATTIDPYRYLVWWRGQTKPPGGTHLNFEVNDAAQTWRVLQ